MAGERSKGAADIDAARAGIGRASGLGIVGHSGDGTGDRSSRISGAGGGAWPEWVPVAARAYLAHTESGESLREIARREGVHASTVLRQVRRFESRRDDPLVDHALGRLRAVGAVGTLGAAGRFAPGRAMSGGGVEAGREEPPLDEARLMREAARILPHLLGTGRVLVVAADMERAVVLRDEGAGAERLAVLGRSIAEAFALRDWIACLRAGRVAQYGLAPAGRLLLRQFEPGRAGGRALAEVPGPGGRLRAVGGGGREEEARFRPQPESPVAVLGRRRERDGAAFLSTAEVVAAGRLHEDFELAQMESSAGLAQDWQRLLSGRQPGQGGRSLPIGSAPAAARARVEAALAELGPGLGDVVLLCVCRQEGIETAERRLGWAARSGKIVLRIALARLVRHYALQGEAGKLMG